LQEWFDSNGRELGLKRILLTLLGARGSGGMMEISGAKAPSIRKDLFAALKRCATQKLKRCPSQSLHAAVETHVSQRTRTWGTRLAFWSLAVCCGPLQAQSPAPVGSAAAAPGRRPMSSYPRECLYGRAVECAVQFDIARGGDRGAGRPDSGGGKNVDIQKLKGPQTQVIDLGGHFVMPGFNDAHLHLADAGLQKLNVDLAGVKTLDELP
jgi:hypothetical protein